MGDAVALTDYLRDYIWSIGITQMRAAAPSGEAPAMAMPQPSLPPRDRAGGEIDAQSARRAGGQRRTPDVRNRR